MRGICDHYMGLNFGVFLRTGLYLDLFHYLWNLAVVQAYFFEKNESGKKMREEKRIICTFDREGGKNL